MDARCCRWFSLVRNARRGSDACAAGKLLKHWPNGRIVLTWAGRQSTDLARACGLSESAQTEKPIRSGIHRSTRELEAAIVDYIRVHIQRPKPFM